MAQVDISSLYDAVVIGGGPAGLTAALYLARARYRVLVVEKDRFGGQITITEEVVNYPGVLRASGPELTETMRQQAQAFGAEFLLAEVHDLDLSGEVKHVKTSKGELACHAILLATGAAPRSVGFAGEQEFRGHGVAYCATCDGEFFTGKDVFVIGGGFAAAEESVFLTKYARHVTLLVREEDFTCAPAAAEPARNHEKITVLFNTEVVEASGDSALRRLHYRNIKTGEDTFYEAAEGESFGIFVFVGYAPATQLVSGIAELDPAGYVLTDDQQMTSADGLFAAGDVCVKTLRQVATAVGQAAQTATDMERYLKAAQERTGLIPVQPQAIPGAQVTSESSSESAGSALFDADVLQQLQAVFARMQQPVELRLHLDERPVSQELEAYMQELAALSEKLSVSLADTSDDLASELPYVAVHCADGTASGLAFHGVPGGHEFTSFVLGLYNVSGPGQPIDDADAQAIAALQKPVSLRVLVGLSCTMCPEVVVAAQRIAADNPLVTAEVYDINHFGAYKERYDVMSVPCLVVERPGEDPQVSFGKKNLADVLSLL